MKEYTVYLKVYVFDSTDLMDAEQVAAVVEHSIEGGSLPDVVPNMVASRVEVFNGYQINKE